MRGQLREGTQSRVSYCHNSSRGVRYGADGRHALLGHGLGLERHLASTGIWPSMPSICRITLFARRPRHPHSFFRRKGPSIYDLLEMLGLFNPFHPSVRKTISLFICTSGLFSDLPLPSVWTSYMEAALSSGRGLRFGDIDLMGRSKPARNKIFIVSEWRKREGEWEVGRAVAAADRRHAAHDNCDDDAK